MPVVDIAEPKRQLPFEVAKPLPQTASGQAVNLRSEITQPAGGLCRFHEISNDFGKERRCYLYLIKALPNQSR